MMMKGNVPASVVSAIPPASGSQSGRVNAVEDVCSTAGHASESVGKFSTEFGGRRRADLVRNE